MKTKTLRFVLATLTALFALAPLAMAQTRLYVPRFQYSPDRDTQFLVVNAADGEADVDLWGFRANGELLGQFRLHLNARSTRSMTLGEAFGLTAETSGWLGIVSPSDGIQLSYTAIGDRLAEGEGHSIAAVEWTTQAHELTVDRPGLQVLHISNPNSFETQIMLNGIDQTGRFAGRRDVTLAPFAQIDAPLASILADGGRVSLQANAQIISSLDEFSQRRSSEEGRTPLANANMVQEQLDLIIDSAHALGAYQVTLWFDPGAVLFSNTDIEAGTAPGFDARPLAVNIDNATGEITIGSFQVGASPRGRLAVARLTFSRRANLSARFGMRVDSAADEAGNTLASSDLAVGLVRVGGR